jgi:hypothetical protein
VGGEWKKAILHRVANEVGARIGMAWADDSITLVEEAERQGFRSRSFISSVLERMSPKAKLGEVELEVALQKMGSPNPAATVQRWLKGREPVWLFIDDVDQNFQNNALHKVKVSSFFVAAREMVNAIPELRMRAAVRPNVWTTIKMEYEALSHIEQYITDLTWNEDANRRLLAKRVEGYLRRRDLFDSVLDNLPTDERQRERALISLVFEDPMEWGKRTTAEGEHREAEGEGERERRMRPPIVVLHTLSKHRPRWLIELAKFSARRAAAARGRTISRTDILDELDQFGKRRILDTVAEFKSQCPEVEELVSAFNREAEEYTTAQLLDLIERKVLNHLHPRIAGVIGTARALDVAAFLFQIGFFFGRREFADGSYEHITYSDRPSLLRARTGVDDGVTWEIHPVFRQALEIRDASGREVARTQTLKRGLVRRRPP